MQLLTKKQFDILEKISLSNCFFSQRELSKLTNYSLGTINTAINELIELGYMDNNRITEQGLKILENFAAKRAIFLAAGFGSRLVPITLNTPKPLIRVNGKRIIDGLIDACIEAGINEIYIVRGYLKEQFNELINKYPMIKFIDNDLYNETNNISSALLVKDILSNAYVFEADLYMYNPKIIKKYHYQSNFLGIFKERTDDWCLDTRKGIIVNEKIGGVNCYQLVGISYWNYEDGKKLSHDIEESFNMPGGRELFWEQVPLVKCKDKYNVQVNKCFDNDIVEIDTFKELKQIDKSYDV